MFKTWKLAKLDSKGQVNVDYLHAGLAFNDIK